MEKSGFVAFFFLAYVKCNLVYKVIGILSAKMFSKHVPV